MAENEEFEKKVEKQLSALKAKEEAQKRFNAEQANSSNIVDKITANLEQHANLIDKSGTLSALMAGNLNNSQKASLVLQASFITIVKSALKASDLTKDIAKSTGISADNAKSLQKEFIKVANNSGKIFVTSERLNKSFSTLTAQTGLVADFGGDTLETFTELNTILGLSEEQSGKLSLLARLQSEDTRGILENTTETIGALIKQKGVAISGRAVLEDVSNVTSDIAVSLGMNPKLIAEASVEARAFGATLNDVNQIAGNLLNFETSINAELQAELLTGKQLNFEKARLLALDNDLAGVSRELLENDVLRSEFLTGNRLEQEAIAEAIGISRESMADLVMQSEFNRLSASEFKDEFGEITFNQFAALSASEKFQESFNKIKSAVMDVGIAFLPIIDSIAEFIAKLAESENLFPKIVAAFTTIATLSLVSSIAQVIGAFSSLGVFGIGLGLAAAVGIPIFAYNQAENLVNSIEDGVIDPNGGLVVSGRKGSIQLDNNDSIIAGTNLGGGIDYDKMEEAVRKGALKAVPNLGGLKLNAKIKYDSFEARKSSAFNGSYQRDVRENSSFA